MPFFPANLDEPPPLAGRRDSVAVDAGSSSVTDRIALLNKAGRMEA
jgi:hypothetical protein